MDFGIYFTHKYRCVRGEANKIDEAQSRYKMVGDLLVLKNSASRVPRKSITLGIFIVEIRSLWTFSLLIPARAMLNF
jgi:hypothetical protein